MPFPSLKSRKDASVGVEPSAKSKRFGSFMRGDKDKNNNKISSSTGSITSIESRLGGNEVVIPLLPTEEKCYLLDGSSISTLTWFQGDSKEATKILENKISDVVNANPWLGGRVTKRQGKPCIVYPDDADSDSDGWDSERSANLKSVTNLKKTSLHRTVPIDDLADLCKSFLVQNGPKHLLWKVTVIPCCEFPEQYFAVVHSLSSAAADSSTYYTIHNMLLAKAAIQPLKVERLMQTNQMQKEILGRKEFGLMDTPIYMPGLVSGAIKSTMLSSPMTAKDKQRFFLVDNEKLQQETATALAVDAFNGVDTNDVLTSWFFRQSECNSGLMVMNLRNRLTGHSNQLAGNYENTLCYYPKEYASPQTIRQTLVNPSSWNRQVVKSSKGQFTLVSNWAALALNSSLPRCREELHIPLIGKGKYTLPSNLNAGIIFRAGPGQTAMFVVGNAKVMRRLENNSLESDDILE